MQGWKLTQGEYRKKVLTEDEIWAKFNHIFSTKSVNRTSYKFCFIKSLLENVFNADDEGYISFDDIYEKFTEIYWYLTVKYNLRQGDRNKVYIPQKIIDMYNCAILNGFDYGWVPKVNVK